MFRRLTFSSIRFLLVLISVLAHTGQVGRAQDPAQTGKPIKTDAGAVFMEEVTPAAPPKAAAGRVPLDMWSLGVPVSPEGKIVPLIQKDRGPVMEYGSDLKAYFDPLSNYAPAWLVNPYGGYLPNWGPMWNVYGKPVYPYNPFYNYNSFSPYGLGPNPMYYGYPYTFLPGPWFY